MNCWSLPELLDHHQLMLIEGHWSQSWFETTIRWVSISSVLWWYFQNTWDHTAKRCIEFNVRWGCLSIVMIDGLCKLAESFTWLKILTGTGNLKNLGSFRTWHILPYRKSTKTAYMFRISAEDFCQVLAILRFPRDSKHFRWYCSILIPIEYPIQWKSLINWKIGFPMRSPRRTIPSRLLYQGTILEYQ